MLSRSDQRYSQHWINSSVILKHHVTAVASVRRYNVESKSEKNLILG